MYIVFFVHVIYLLLKTGLKQFFGGERFWTKMQKIRKHVCGGKYVPLKAFMTLVSIKNIKYYFII